MSTNQNTKRILIFLAFAFGIPWAAALAISLSGMMGNNPTQAAGLANYFFIFTPWLANIATRLVTKEGWGNFGLRPNFKRGWRFYLAAWLLPFLAVCLGGGIFYLAFPQSFDPSLGVVRNLAGSSPAAVGANPWVIFLSITLSILFVSAAINSVVSLGEELGWRGYLLPKLTERFAGSGLDRADGKGVSKDGSRKAALLTGLIHGVWHWPLMLLTASLVPGFTYLTLLVYLVLTCSLSILLSWAAQRSGSVWPAAIGHGTLNAVSALPGFLLLSQAVPLIGPDPTGLIGGMGFTLLALVLFFSRRAFAVRMEAGSKQVEPIPASV